MSPTVPPVLVLSLLLVSPLPLAEAGRSTDLFALIRGTLKYWRKIYKIYEEEVVLGYCWADYFLQREEPATNSPMPPSMILDPTSFLGVDIFEGGKKKDSDPAHIFIDRGRRFARDKRSYETANFTENPGALFENAQRKGYRWLDAGKKSGDTEVRSTSRERINLGKNGETVVDSLARFIWLDREQERNRAKRSYDTTKEGVLGILGRVVGNGVKETEDSRRNSKSINGSGTSLRVRNVEFLKNKSGWVNRNGGKIGNDIEMKEDNANYSWAKFANGKSLNEITIDSYLESNDHDFAGKTRFSKTVLNAILQSTKTMVEKVFENLEKTLRPTSNTRLDPPGERASKVSKVSEKAAAVNRGKISLAEPNSSSKRADRIQKTTFSVDFLNASETDRQRSNAAKNFPTHPGDQSGEDKKAAPDSKTFKARVPSKIQTDCQRCRGPSTDRDVKDPSSSSPSFPRFSSRKLNPAVRQESRDEPRTPIEGKFEGKFERSQTGSTQKSTSPRPAPRGKLLRRRSSDGASGSSQTREATPTSGARFEDTRPGEGTGDNREPGDPSRRKSYYASSNLGFPGVAERRSFRGNYRRNLRRKRDANDRIRSRRGRLGSSYNSTSVDEIPRCSTSHVPAVYGTSATQIRSPSAMEKHRSATKNEIGPYYLEARQESVSLNCETTTALAANSTQKKRSVYYPRKFLMERWRRQWPGQRAKAKVEEETRKGDAKGSSSKQLARTRDNRYRTRNSLLPVENSAENRRAGKKRTAVPYPVGRGSLLSVSQPRFMGDYENSTSVTARNSRIARSWRVEDQGRRSSVTRAGARGVGRDFATVFHLRQAFMGFLRALGIFVHVGRQLVDYVESNSALACTKDYLVGKAVQWIDS